MINNPQSQIRNQQSTISVGCASSTPLGPVWVAVSERGLVAVEIGVEQDVFLARLVSRGYQDIVLDSQQAAEAVLQIGEYLEGRRRDFELPVDWSGMGAFQEQVLRRVCAVPYGRVTTYGAIARELGRPQAARAVGRANATNPVSLVIPCHRVVGSDGKLHGYGAPGGLETKTWLLRLEKDAV